jgi:ribosomal protein S18 acetylase RimI-like enzyme
MRLRPYVPADRDACVAVLASSVPTYAQLHELGEYAAWLDRACVRGAEDPCEYLVGERDGAVVCAGGVAFATTAPVATLCWGIVRADLHRRGLGRALLLARLDRVRARGGVARVLLDTTDAAVGFFLRHGFVVTGRVRDGYGPGIDRLDLELDAALLRRARPSRRGPRPKA